MNTTANGVNDGERAPKLPPAYRLVARDSVPSTMDVARDMARDGADDGTLVWAREQVGGRGRRGRAWESPRGNLYLTMVLRPEIPVSRAHELGFVAGLGLVDALGVVLPAMVEVFLKWPNDVLLNHRKVAGLLLEAETATGGELEYLLLGIGCNVRKFPEDALFPATSIHFEGAEPSISEVDVLEAFGRHFLAWVNRWLDEGFEPVRAAWLRHAWRLGEEIEVDVSGQKRKGIFRDIGPSGALLLEIAKGETIEIPAGDVLLGE